MADGWTATQGELIHPALAGYSARERRAILVHKYFLGIEMNCDPGLDRAIESWEHRYGCQWRREQHLSDCKEQMDQIDRHRRQLARRAGCDIPWEQAAHHWITRHAAQWRAAHEG